MDQPGDYLDGTRWSVARIAGADVDPDAPRSVEFSGGRVTGQVGVNRFTGDYSIEGDVLVVGALARTLMAGSPERMELEDRFHAAFSGRLPVAVGEIMVLGDIELSYVAPTRLRGSVWYRERMALQPGSSVVVELHDASSTMIASQVIGDAVAPPVEFDLDAARPLDETRYRVHARIEGPDGASMWSGEVGVDPERQPVEVMVHRV